MLITCCICLIIRNNLTLNFDESIYTSVECCVGYEFVTNELEKVRCIIDFLNDNRFCKNLKSVDTLASPEIVMVLSKKDGTIENIGIYSGAWEEGLYLMYNNAQYEIENPDKFLKGIEEVFSY